MRSERLVVPGVAALVLLACNHVVGLTGYAFVDLDASVPSDAATPVDAADGAAVCALSADGLSASCRRCVEKNCCEEANACLDDAVCLARFRIDSCVADSSCREIVSCTQKNRCDCP